MEDMNFINKLAYGLGIAIVGMFFIILPIYVVGKLIHINIVLAIAGGLFTSVISAVMLSELKNG